jgi:hypothetical protein
MKRGQMPRGWAEEAMPFYLEGGEAVGRLLFISPEREPEIWALIGGTSLWKRWYLEAFKRLWSRANKAEARRVVCARYEKKRWARNRSAILEGQREASMREAMPTRPPRARKDAGNEPTKPQEPRKDAGQRARKDAGNEPTKPQPETNP